MLPEFSDKGSIEIKVNQIELLIQYTQQLSVGTEEDVVRKA